MRVSPALSSLIPGLALCACSLVTSEPTPPVADVLVTDSTEFGARLVGNAYAANIRYTFTNPARVTVSRNYCQAPPPPDLQKNINGSWVSVFPLVSPLCLSIPPFRIEPGASYRGFRPLRLDGVANVGMDPRIGIDSVNGTYRLRWSWVIGPDPDAPGAARLEALSNEFRIVVR